MGENMRVLRFKYEDLTSKYARKILFDDLIISGKAGRFILVIGNGNGNHEYINKAVELYKDGMGEKIVFIGGKIEEALQENTSEAEYMKTKAVELGIPKKDIMVQDIFNGGLKIKAFAATMIVDRYSTNKCASTVCIIASKYNIKRCALLIQKEAMGQLCFSMYPMDENDLNNDHEREELVIKMEAFKLVCYCREGAVADFNI